ncbi:DUF2092 domain-containing protein [Desulfobacterota bacterium AH_259_B03_O07]|nr:DUF2092 domain-containing protein [Desulfobacterota bacterium AH_259_B03_O07]
MKMLTKGLTMLTLLFLAPLLAIPSHSQQTSVTGPNKSEERAMAVLKRTADFLSQAQRFSVTEDIGFDAVQDSGQKIEFGETRNIVLSRPDHLRIDETKRDGSKSGLVFNGKDITVFHVKENVYATEAKPGTVDEAISYFVNDLGMRVPLAELLDSNLPKMLPERVREAAYVEQSSIAGVPCDHIALRGDQADMQLWIAQGDKPLPQRVVITYRREDGRPQFWANFKEWNLAPKVPDSLFTFSPPKGAVKIAFSPRQMMQPGEQKTKGGK